jgi:hypothetical protein
MTNLIPEKLALLGRAAELRAEGSPWAAVSTELKVADEELRTLRVANSREYDRLAIRAEREFERETARACLARLRELLKSQDERIAMTAAGTIIRYELARMRNEIRVEEKTVQRQRKKLRDELPPLPGPRVREHDARGPVRNEQTSVGAKPTAAPRVIAQSTSPNPPSGNGPAMTPKLAAAIRPPIAPQPVSALPKPKSTVMDALRRKKWVPRGL